MKLNLFVPCFMDQLYPETAFNTIKVLEHFGCEILYNPQQTCCGQPAFNSGYWDEARAVAQHFCTHFDAQYPVIMPSASCTGMVNNYYPELFKNTTLNEYKSLEVKELTSFLYHQLNVKTLSNATFPAKVMYHHSCAGLRECGIKKEPIELLQSIQGLELLYNPEEGTCCGFGGTFTVKFTDISTAMAEQKVQQTIDLGADTIVSTDASCLMHIGAYIHQQDIPIKTMHIADLLAEALAL
jgi:L-lactate dehydrogenase complex protein LldE